MLMQIIPNSSFPPPADDVTEVKTNIYVTSFGPVSDTDMVRSCSHHLCGEPGGGAVARWYSIRFCMRKVPGLTLSMASSKGQIVGEVEYLYSGWQ